MVCMTSKTTMLLDITICPMDLRRREIVPKVLGSILIVGLELKSRKRGRTKGGKGRKMGSLSVIW